MRRIFKFKITTAVITLLLLGTLIIALISPKTLAVVTSKVYTTVKYNNQNLRYVSVEYAYGFGDYSVVYETKEGEQLGFLVTPKYFPVVVSHDPLQK